MRGIVRAQVSLEYLLISLLSLTLLSISVLALFGTKEYGDRVTDQLAFRSSALSLSNAVNDACALGTGNSRMVLLHTRVSVSYADGLVRFGGANSSVIKQARCQVEPVALEAGEVVVKNSGGEIRIFTRQTSWDDEQE